MTEHDEGANATSVTDDEGTDVGAIRKTTDLSKLTDEQRAAVDAAVKAHKKVGRGRSTLEGYISARDDLIRQALSIGVGQKLLALQLDLNTALIWKIKNNLTTQEVERRRQGGGDAK